MRFLRSTKWIILGLVLLLSVVVGVSIKNSMQSKSTERATLRAGQRSAHTASAMSALKTSMKSKSHTNSKIQNKNTIRSQHKVVKKKSDFTEFGSLFGEKQLDQLLEKKIDSDETNVVIPQAETQTALAEAGVADVTTSPLFKDNEFGPEDYVFASSENGTIYATRLGGPFPTIEPFIEGLQNPQGMAVDLVYKKFYVADLDLENNKGYIYRFRFGVNEDFTLIKPRETDRFTIYSGIRPRDISIDSHRNVYFTDEGTGKLMRFGLAESYDLYGPGLVEVVSKDDIYSMVSPFGLSVHLNKVLWTNSSEGTSEGSLVYASNLTMDVASTKITVLSKKVDEARWLCETTHNIFFTDSNDSLYAAEKTGVVKKLTSSLTSPRGVAATRHNQVFVVDYETEAIHQVEMSSVNHFLLDTKDEIGTTPTPTKRLGFRIPKPTALMYMDASSSISIVLAPFVFFMYLFML